MFGIFLLVLFLLVVLADVTAIAIGFYKKSRELSEKKGENK